MKPGEFIQFLGMARGSNHEVQTQLQLAKDLNMGDRQEIETAEGLSHTQSLKTKH